MQSVSEKQPSAVEHPSITLTLREAKRLHRLAQSDSLSSSLPVLRRLLAAQVMRNLSLPDAFRRRSAVQRKHLLRLLAIEAGYRLWEDYRAALVDMHPSALDHFIVLRDGWAFAHSWFASEQQAKAQVTEAGGRILQIGKHVVALSAEQVEHYRLEKRHE